MKKKALFLDRDGVINVDHGYLYKVEDFEFNKDIFNLLHLFLEKGFLLFIITNQSGIGRGYYQVQDFLALTKWMLSHFDKQDIPIQGVQFCPHLPDEGCSCRKPRTGMIDTILEQFDIDIEHSWLIGDKQSDIDLANNANILNSIAIGEKKMTSMRYQFSSISECKTFIENNEREIFN